MDVDSPKVSSFTLNIGELDPVLEHTTVSVSVAIGGTAIAEANAVLEAKASDQLIERELPVLVLDCVSVEAADTLAWTIAESWKQAVLGDSPNSVLDKLATAWKKEEEQLVNLKAEAMGTTVHLSLLMCPWILQHYKTYSYILFTELGDILSHTHTFTAKIELGHSLPELLNGGGFLIKLLSSINLTAELTLWQGLSTRVQTLLAAYVKQLDALAFLSILGLFSSGTLNLTFNSPEQLPRQVLEAIPPSTVVLQLLTFFIEQLTTDEKKILETAGRSLTGVGKVYCCNPFGNALVEVSIPGLAGLILKLIDR